MAAIRYSNPSRAALAPSRANNTPLTGFLTASLRRAGRAARLAGSLALALMALAQPLAMSVSPVAQALPSAGAPAGQYFAATNKSVSGAFLDTYRRFGLGAVGYPLSDVQQENGRSVQYFERVRMELHPEAASQGFPVMFSRLGDDMSRPSQPFATVSPFASTPGRVYFKETGHSLSQVFLQYWKAHGSVQLFGYPISEQIQQDGLTVQWFERARFEYHPELAGKGQMVQLSLLGRQAYDKTGHGTSQPVAARSAPQVPAKVSTSAKAPAPAAAPPAQPAQVALNGVESYLLKAMNEQRAAAGLVAVELNGAVTDVARSRSSDMAARNYFSHTTPDGAQFFSMLSGHGITYKYAGEILARNNYDDAQAAPVAMQSYLNSPPHKAIMLDGRYTGVGIGYAKSEEDKMHYFTVLFVQQ